MAAGRGEETGPMSLTAAGVDDPLVERLLDPPAAWRDRVAFTSAAGSLTFADLAAGTRQVAGWLRHEAGVTPGDRVAIYLPRPPLRPRRDRGGAAPARRVRAAVAFPVDEGG
jgi:acyl-coenzyme A synthetase/AMP-(fatty) acid ligase